MSPPMKTSWVCTLGWAGRVLAGLGRESLCYLIEGRQLAGIGCWIVTARMLEVIVNARDCADPPAAARIDGNPVSVSNDCGISSLRGLPPPCRPSLALRCAPTHLSLAQSRCGEIALHMTRTDASSAEYFRVVWMLHVVDVPDCASAHRRLDQKFV